MHEISKFMNHDGKAYYSKMLDDRFGSNCFADQTQAAPAGARIQKKAYRANTQSNQVDGLYKTEKFEKRTNLLNNTRVDFNILRPLENPTTSMQPQKIVRPDHVMETIRNGTCH
jgi:hypothetical protein